MPRKPIDETIEDIEAMVETVAPIPEPPKTKAVKYSIDEFAKIKTRTDDMIKDLAERDNDFDLKERAFLVKPIGKTEGNPEVAHARTLFDTSAQTTIKKMVGMFLGKRNVVPTIIVKNQQEGDPDKVEAFVRGLLKAQQAMTSSNWIVDGFYSTGIYGEVTALIHNRMSGISDVGEQSKVKVPFIFRVPHPRTSYPKYSTGWKGGLYRHVSKVVTTLGECKEDYPDADKFEGDDDEEVTIVDYMCRASRVHCVWLEEHSDEPILWANLPSQLDNMPRVARLSSDAPGFLEKEEDRRQGLLNTYIKSGLWAAFNTLYSIMYTNIFDFVDPDIVIKAENEPRAAQIASELDWQNRPMTVRLLKDESIGPLAKQLVPPELMTFAAMAGYQRSDALIPPIAGGTTPGGVFAASGLNLLSENANRAINYLSDTMNLLVGDAVNDALQWAKWGEYQPSVWTEKGWMTLTPSDIGDCWIDVEFNPDRSAQQQIVMGIVNMMAQLRMGEKDWLPHLEKAQLIDSSTDAEDRMYERAVNEAERMAVGKTVIDEAQRLNKAIGQVPDLNAPQPSMMPQPAMPAQPAPTSPVPPGMMPPGAGPELGLGAPNQVEPAPPQLPPDISAMVEGTLQ